MSNPQRRDAFVLLLLGAAAAVGAFAFGRLAPGADDALVRLLNPDAPSAFDRVLALGDALGPLALQGLGGAALVVVFLVKRAAPARATAVAWLLGFAWAQFGTNVLKAAVRRARPVERADLVEALRTILPAPDVARSFPSGHVTTATVVAAGFWLLAGALGVGGRRRHALVLVPLAMAWDRIALGHHHPSDACAGAAVGLLGVGAANLLWTFVAREGAPAVRADGASGLRARIVPAAAGLLVAVGAAVAVDGGATHGVDPITGAPPDRATYGSFEAKRPWTRWITEPVAGPALAAARVDRLRELAIYGGAAWAGLVLGLAVLRRLRGPGAFGVATYLAAFTPVLAASLFASAAATPDRFKREGKDDGVFLDWHLHGGDPVDGRQTVKRTANRQKARGVDWAVTTRHTSRPEADSELAHGVFGTEWSGADYPRTQTAHVLVLGSAEAVDAANAAPTELDAVRAAKARGALVIVAHYWRTAARLRVPSLEEFRAAGVDGFEVANRYADSGERLKAAAAEVDAFCRRHGLLRLSFSDDHAIPVGSPCVTYLAGVDEDDLRGDGAKDVLSRLRRDAPEATRIPVEAVVPLRFEGRGPAWPAVPTWLAWFGVAAWIARRLRP